MSVKAALPTAFQLQTFTMEDGGRYAAGARAPRGLGTDQGVTRRGGHRQPRNRQPRNRYRRKTHKGLKTKNKQNGRNGHKVCAPATGVLSYITPHQRQLKTSLPNCATLIAARYEWHHAYCCTHTLTSHAKKKRVWLPILRRSHPIQHVPSRKQKKTRVVVDSAQIPFHPQIRLHTLS